MLHPADLAVVYSFGPFELDARSRRLTRRGEPVPLPDRHVDILIHLLAHAGHVVSKDALVQAGWNDVAVTDNSLEQAISSLRRVLGQSAGATRYIETLSRQGYRVGVPVARTASRHSAEALDAMLAPHRAFVEGRAALETLERDAVEHARGVFENILRTLPDYAPAHVGLANALALRFEATRAENAPDRDALARAQHHAGEACRLDPASAEGWSVLGLVSHQSRDGGRAVAALRRSITLEPDNWRHHVRLAYVGWGEERLRHAHRALQLFPGVALAHWLAATVYIARRAFTEAEQELVAGAAAQDRQRDGEKFRAVGLHLMLGLLRLEQGDDVSAVRALMRELEPEEATQIYTQQARANAWCGIAALRLRQGDAGAAVQALDHAIGLVAVHPVALAARAAVTGDAADRTRLERCLCAVRDRGGAVEAAFAEATSEALTGHPERAASAVYEALRQEPPGSSAWTVPVDPFMRVSAHTEQWAAVLSLLCTRAA